MKILSAGQMRRVEQKCAEVGISSSALMENAGRAVAEETRRILGPNHKKIVVLVGPGNNGGDGEVAARYLKGWGFNVAACLVSGRPHDDPNLALVRDARVPIVECEQDSRSLSWLQDELTSASVVLDCVFGTGFKVADGAGSGRNIKEHIAEVFNLVRLARKKRPDLLVLAVDLPSGLDADTASVDPACLAADETLALGYPKPGLFSSPGSESSGRIKVLDIGIPPGLTEDSVGELATDGLIRSILPARPMVSNKGTYGRAMVVAGSESYMGAAYLACSGAMRSGAGLVTLAVREGLRHMISAKPAEVTYLPLPDSTASGADSAAAISKHIGGYTAMLIGPGLGQDTEATKLVRALLLGKRKPQIACVIDADALNTLAKVRTRSLVWRRLTDDAILTPHPGEMSRLTGIAVSDIQHDRIHVANDAARDWNKTVVLKGAYTVVASSRGNPVISPFANAGLASAGTGDVLAGVITGLVAQGVSLFEAAVCGVYVHGKAGELVSRRLGDAGTIASDLLSELPLAMKEIKAG